MRTECITAVAKAIGRDVTESEALEMQQRVRDAMLVAAKQNPGDWRFKTEREKFELGAKLAAQRLVKEAEKAKQRLEQNLQAHDRITTYTAAQVKGGHDANKIAALTRLMASLSDGQNHSLSAESLSRGYFATAMSQAIDAFDAIHPGLWGLIANKAAESQLLRALHGETAGMRPEILKAAHAWKEVTDTLREQFNALGGIVGKLDNWGLPHMWADHRVLRAGQETFVRDMLRLVDRRAYVNPDGSFFSDSRMVKFLQSAYVAIATNGASEPLDLQPKSLVGGVKANRHRIARQIHLKDAASAQEAMEKYGAGSLQEQMHGHLRRLSRDIALVQTFGPNADYVVAHFLDRFRREASIDSPGDAGKMEKVQLEAAHLYDTVAGNAAPVPNRRMANAARAIRQWLGSAKLGSAAVTAAITDPGTVYLTAHVNHLPLVQVFTNELRALNPADQMEKRLARRAGLLTHTVQDELDRFGSDTLASQIPAKVANALMRASGLNVISEVRRRAFTTTMLDAIGAVTRTTKRLEDLDPDDWKLLRDKGVTAEDWAVWHAAETHAWRGNDTVLTADAVLNAPGFPKEQRVRAATRLMGAVLEEQDMAVVEPGARERAFMSFGTRPGTVKGEIVRSFWQFKSFPLAMISRHWRRGMGLYDSKTSKAGYLATLFAAQTVLGAVALEANDLLSGRDPRSLNPSNEFGTRNWLAAVLKGGSLGLYGDFLFNESTQFGQTLLSSAAGPTAQAFTDLDILTRQNILQAMRGDETNFGAEFARVAKSYTPGASLWYAKAALDRMVFSQLQEYFSEGYSAAAAERAHSRAGTSYWWNPGEMTPENAPNLANATAEETPDAP